MKTIFRLTPFLLLLAACPYDASVELSSYDTSMKVEKKLFGDWQAFDVNGEGSREELHVSKGDKEVYHVQHDPYDEDNKKIDGYYYRAYATEIGGAQLLNVEKKDGKWNYYRLELVSNDEFILRWVEDEFMQENLPFENPAAEEIRKFLEEHIKDDGLFGPEIHFYREGSDAYKKAKAGRK